MTTFSRIAHISQTATVKGNRVTLATGETVSISAGNTKTGAIPALSLEPVRTCPGATAGCKGSCYALKSFRQYPAVRAAWSGNADLAERDPEALAGAVAAWLRTRKTPARMFRLHVAGDFLNADHFRAFVQLARLHPETTFYGYTKTPDLPLTAAPSNLRVRVSVWSDGADAPAGTLAAYCRDGAETRIPADALTCPATAGRDVTCATCRLCFMTTRPVVFNLH